MNDVKAEERSPWQWRLMWIWGAAYAVMLIGLGVLIVLVFIGCTVDYPVDFPKDGDPKLVCGQWRDKIWLLLKDVGTALGLLIAGAGVGWSTFYNSFYKG